MSSEVPAPPAQLRKRPPAWTSVKDEAYALLECQRPREERATRDELIFIIPHHIGMLWLKLGVNELQDAVVHVERDELRDALRLLRRTYECLDRLTDGLRILDHLAPWEYAELRLALVGSGFDVPGFKELRAVAADAGRAFTARLDAHDLTLLELYQRGREFDDLYQVAETLLDIDQAMLLWRSRHIRIVERQVGLIGQGTAGTEIAQLRRLLEIRLFPALWEVRADLIAAHDALYEPEDAS